MGTQTLDDRDPSIDYSTGWAQGGSSLEYNSTTTWTVLAGSSARISFHGTGISVYGTISAKEKGSVKPESVYSIDGGLPVRFRATQAASPQYSQRFFQSPDLPETDHVLTIINAGVRADPFSLDFVMIQSSEDLPPVSSLTASLSSSASVPHSTSRSTTTMPPPAVTVTVTSPKAASTGVVDGAQANGNSVAVSGASKNNAGAVAGGIMAGIVASFLALFAFLIWRRKREKKREKRNSQLKRSSVIARTRPSTDSAATAKVQSFPRSPPPPAAPVMHQQSSAHYSDGYHYPGGYAPSNLYNSYQQHSYQPQPQQLYLPQVQYLPQYQPQLQQYQPQPKQSRSQLQPPQQPTELPYASDHDAYEGISPSPHPQPGYTPPSQLLRGNSTSHCGCSS